MTRIALMARTSQRASFCDYMFNLLLISKLSAMTEPICRDPAQVSAEPGGQRALAVLMESQ